MENSLNNIQIKVILSFNPLLTKSLKLENCIKDQKIQFT
jgi:hypothetical protein